MGLIQVTPCANMPSPERAAEDHQKNCPSSTVNHISNNGGVLVPIEETKSLQLPAACNYDIGAYASRRSHSSNLLLSKCSSLASLPSLGFSFNAGSSDYGVSKAQLLAAGGAISANCRCTATLKSLGDQVAAASLDDGLFFSASSGCDKFSLKTWLRREGGDCVSYEMSAAGFGMKNEGAVRAMVVVGDQVFTAHCSDLKIRVWARQGKTMKKEKVYSCSSGGGGGGGDGGAAAAADHEQYKLVAALPTRWDCLVRSMAPGGYTQVRRHHRKLWIKHADAISALAVDAKQGLLYSGSWDRSVKVWRLRDFKCVESFKAHDDAINTLTLSADGNFLYTAAADGKIKVWTRAEGRYCMVATLEAHRSAVNALALSADGALLYSGACDKAIVVWEREDSAQHASLAGALRGHRQAVLSLSACCNSSTLCSGSADKSIRVWQRLSGRLHVCVAVLQGHSAPIKSLSLLCVSPPSASSACLFLYSAALDHDIKVWQLNLSFTH